MSQDQGQLTVGQLRSALALFPDDYDVQLVVDKRSFQALFGLSVGMEKLWVASEPLVRVSAKGENNDKHRRVWLYGEGRTS